MLELVQEHQGFVEVFRQVPGHAGDGQALAGDVARRECSLGGESIGADDHVPAHGSQVVQPLLHGGGHSGDLHGGIRAATAG